MSFSAFSVGRQMITLTSNKQPQLRLGSKPVAGGSFTPSTLEAAFVMRSSLDYQYEKAFNDKYKAMMQNRLNELQKKLQEAYTDILNVSMSQQVGQNADRNLRADVRLDGKDGSTNASLLSSVAGENGFEDIGINVKTTSRSDLYNETSVNYLNPGAANSGTNIWRAPGIGVDMLDAGQVYADDGLAGYSRALGGEAIQFRTLLDTTTAAGNVSGEMHITMRVEQDPPPPTSAGVSLDLLNSVTSGILGGPPDPTYFNQKLVQQSTSYKTGGFWSTVNYLYNFAPREIKYSYAVGYTANSDEAGDNEYLINGQLVDDRDIPGAGQAYLTSGSRVKWQSFDPTEGYQLERSGTSQFYDTVNNRLLGWIDSDFDASGDGLRTQVWNDSFTDADARNKASVNIVENLIFQSGTYTYNGAFVNEYLNLTQTTANTAGGPVSLLSSNIELGSTFRHKVDMTVNSNSDTTVGPDNQDFQVMDRGRIRSSLFFNHYEVEVRTVEYNNAARQDVLEIWNSGSFPAGTDQDFSDDAIGKLYAYGGIVRSKAVDASKNYDILDPDSNPLTNNNQITRSDGNISNSFNGEFIQGLHKIHSVNGQNVVGNETKQASPVIGNFEIGKYEGLLRSEGLSRNLLNYTAPSQMEMNAAQAVPTDWYQAELLASVVQSPADPNNGYVWFPFVANTIFTREPDGGNDTKAGFGRPFQERQLVQMRNTFNLTQEEFMELLPAAQWVADATGVRRPTYDKRDYWVDVDLRGIYYGANDPTVTVPKMFVNGREIDLNVNTNPAVVVAASAGGGGATDVTLRVNLKDYLQQGSNTMSLEISDAAYSAIRGNNNYNEGLRITAAAGAGNQAFVDGIINAKIITGYDNVAAVKYNPELERAGTLKVQSRWSARTIPLTAATDSASKLVRMASEPTNTGSSYKVSNSFIELIINMINQQKYRDIFKMGMLSNLNKLAIQGQANLPSGANMQGAVTMYYDTQTQSVVLWQDKLIANS